MSAPRRALTLLAVRTSLRTPTTASALSTVITRAHVFELSLKSYAVSAVLTFEGLVSLYAFAAIALKSRSISAPRSSFVRPLITARRAASLRSILIVVAPAPAVRTIASDLTVDGSTGSFERRVAKSILAGSTVMLIGAITSIAVRSSTMGLTRLVITTERPLMLMK